MMREPDVAQENITLLIGRMDGKLDLLLVHRAEQDARLGVLENRTGSLERWRSYTIGITAAIAALVEFTAHRFGFTG